MAQMFPVLSELELKELEQKSRAEANVYRAFRDKTPSDWLVLHGLNLIALGRTAPAQDAEADFVVFDPRRGFVVVEVKGGGVSRDAKGKWWSQGRTGLHKITDPVEQAKRNKYIVLNSLKASSNWGPTGAPRLLMGHASLFPDLATCSALVGHNQPAQILGASPELNHVHSWVDDVFKFWAGNDSSWRPFGPSGMAIIRSVFCAPVTVRASLALEVEREQRRQFELTRRQALVLQNLRHRARAAIAGSAGTGKTLLAFQHAQALACQGRRTLLVCYTRALADFLKREAVGVANLEVMQFHQLCDWRVKAVMQTTHKDMMAMAVEAHRGADEFDVLKPYALALSTDYDSFRYDAIFVDEGQDFGDEYWLAIELLLSREESAQLYVFYDPNQAIYQLAKDISNLNLGPPLLLTENCRNTKPVHEAAYRYYKGDEVAPPELDGEPITQLVAGGLKEQARAIRAIVSDLLSQGGLKPDEVVVLVAGERKDSHFRALHDLGNPVGVKWSFEMLWQPNGVLVDTVGRFKGLEAAAVLVWCADEGDPTAERKLLYVALSRARNRLWVVGERVWVTKVLQGS